jgi:DNA-binding transcriptional LysR family regulator
LILCASPAYLIAKGNPSHPRELQHHECLGFARSALRTRWTFRDHDDNPVSVPITSKFMVNQSEPLLTACLAGLGIILQPLEVVRGALRAGTLEEVLPAFPCISPPINVVYQRDRRVTPKLRSFIDFCVQNFDEYSLAER